MKSLAAKAFRSLTVEIDPLLVNFSSLSSLRRDPTFFWEEPDADWLLVGFGAAWNHQSAPGPERIVSAAEAGAEIFDQIVHLQNSDVPGPLLVGGFSFSDRKKTSSNSDAMTWSEFPSGLLVLPEITLQRRGTRAWISAVIPTSVSARSAEEIVREVIACLDDGSREFWMSSKDSQVTSNRDDLFQRLVKYAVTEVESGKLAKVVAARSALVETTADPWRVLDVLRRRYPSCAVYGVFRRSSVFVGASPELLVGLQSGKVTSHALAGTVDRGIDALADAELEDQLRYDPKELAEHQYVVQGLRRALHESGVTLDSPSQIEIVKLANVQHLSSSVSGHVPNSTGVLDLVDAVHPTPAVAGLPRTAALEWLAENERLDRGWYAGPIGWMDSALDGSFRVALRCALLEDGRARLFAGAGIVAGSRPDRELAETSAKLGAMFGALSAS